MRYGHLITTINDTTSSNTTEVTGAVYLTAIKSASYTIFNLRKTMTFLPKLIKIDFTLNHILFSRTIVLKHSPRLITGIGLFILTISVLGIKILWLENT